MTTQTLPTYGNLLLAVSVAPKQIGARIRRARKAKGWTQLEFALEADVSPSSVQRWERGQLPKVRELMRLADLLEVPAESLVEPDEPDEAVAARLDRIERQLELLIARSGQGEQEVP